MLLFIASLALATYYYGTDVAGHLYNPMAVLTNSYVLLFGSILTLALFVYILTGRAPLVNTLTSGNLGTVLGKAGEFRNELAAVLGKLLVTTDEHIEPRLQQGQADDVQANFLAYLSRSQEAARTAARRPNALLFLGPSSP